MQNEQTFLRIAFGGSASVMKKHTPNRNSPHKFKPPSQAIVENPLNAVPRNAFKLGPL